MCLLMRGKGYPHERINRGFAYTLIHFSYRQKLIKGGNLTIICSRHVKMLLNNDFIRSVICGSKSAVLFDIFM